jgi:hypothetical protein
VDSGSTHSFISLETASHLHLQPDYRPGIQVTVANGDCVASASICRGIHIFIDKEEFVLDFFVIPLTGYEMVLGVHWLRTLGPILWDFGRVQMSCCVMITGWCGRGFQPVTPCPLSRPR